MSHNLPIAEKYYQAISQKNVHDAAQFLDPAVVLLNPMGEVAGKEAVTKALTGFVASFSDLTVRSRFSANDQAMLVIDLQCQEPIGKARTASLLTIQNEKIVRIELFLDFRPFEKVIKPL